MEEAEKIKSILGLLQKKSVVIPNDDQIDEFFKICDTLVKDKKKLAEAFRAVDLLKGFTLILMVSALETLHKNFPGDEDRISNIFREKFKEVIRKQKSVRE